MFPVANYPAIEWVLSEAIQSGFTQILIAINRNKEIIREYCHYLEPKVSELCEVNFVYQEEANGFGDVLILAQDFLHGSAFGIFLPDGLVPDALPMADLRSKFDKYDGIVFAVRESRCRIPARHGGFQLETVEESVYRIAGVAETDSLFELNGVTAEIVGVGRYLASDQVVGYAKQLSKLRSNSELDDGKILRYMLKIGAPIHAVRISGERYDISTSSGLASAITRLDGRQPEYGNADH